MEGIQGVDQDHLKDRGKGNFQARFELNRFEGIRNPVQQGGWTQGGLSS